MMDAELRDLYQELILDHCRHPRNFKEPASFDHEAQGYNPICGDQLHLYISIGADDRIADASFQGRGCAISLASASMMTDAVRGMTQDEAVALFEQFKELSAQSCSKNLPESDVYDSLRALSGVSAFPSRVKCATLAWHTLEAAMRGTGKATSEK